MLFRSVLGQLIAGQDDPDTAEVEYVAQLTRQPNGSIPSLREAVLNSWGTSLDEVGAKAGEPVTITTDLSEGLTGREIMEKADRRCLELLTPVVACHRSGGLDAGKAHALATQLCQEQLGAERGDVIETLTWVLTDLMPRLDSTSDEIEAILRALDGGFIPPGPSGAPSRGNAPSCPPAGTSSPWTLRRCPPRQVGVKVSSLPNSCCPAMPRHTPANRTHALSESWCGAPQTCAAAEPISPKSCT